MSQGIFILFGIFAEMLDSTCFVALSLVLFFQQEIMVIATSNAVGVVFLALISDRVCAGPESPDNN